MLRIKLTRSTIGNTKRNRLTVAALGLRKMQQVVELPDTPSVRGMIHKVKHMLTVEVVEGTEKAAKPTKAPKAPKAETPVAEVATTEDKPKAKRTTKKEASEDKE